MHLRALWKYALPLGATLMCWLTMRTVASFSIESMARYGFPFAWYAPDASSSMSFDVALGPLFVDLLAYVGTCQLIVSSVAARWSGSNTAARTTSVSLWLVAIASTIVMAMAIGVDTHFVGWTLDGYFGAGSTRAHGIQLGPGDWRRALTASPLPPPTTRPGT